MKQPLYKLSVSLSAWLWCCYQTQVQLLITQNPILKRQLLVERRVCFILEPQQLGEKVDSCPRTKSQLLLMGQGLLREAKLFKQLILQGDSHRQINRAVVLSD